MRISEEEYESYRVKAENRTAPLMPKPHKYYARKVTIDGITFASRLEGQCYVNLMWQVRAGLITVPLLQIPFSLGKHYGKERVYIADFCFVVLATGNFVVADAKGFRTDEYKQKKKTMLDVYGITICELT